MSYFSRQKIIRRGWRGAGIGKIASGLEKYAKGKVPAPNSPGTENGTLQKLTHISALNEY
jgi:hypothetical protein